MPLPSTKSLVLALGVHVAMALAADESHHEHGDHGSRTSSLGMAFGACALVHFITVAVVVVGSTKVVRDNLAMGLSFYAKAFSAGALLATAFMIMIAEGFHLIQDGLEDEASASITFAAPLVLGVFLMLLLVSAGGAQKAGT